MSDSAEDPVGQRHPQAVEPLRERPTELPAVPCAQLPAGAADSPLRIEWDFYRRVVGRLLTEGHEGKWLLIKDEEVVGIWDTEADADAIRRERFFMQPVLMKQVLAREPVLRIGYNRLCRS